jgi:hypothetical protein
MMGSARPRVIGPFP